MPKTEARLERVEFRLEYVEFSGGLQGGLAPSCHRPYFEQQKQRASLRAALREKLRAGWSESLILSYLETRLDAADEVERQFIEELLKTYRESGFNGLKRSIE